MILHHALSTALQDIVGEDNAPNIAWRLVELDQALREDTRGSAVEDLLEAAVHCSSLETAWLIPTLVDQLSSDSERVRDAAAGLLDGLRAWDDIVQPCAEALRRGGGPRCRAAFVALVNRSAALFQRKSPQDKPAFSALPATTQELAVLAVLRRLAQRIRKAEPNWSASQLADDAAIQRGLTRLRRFSQKNTACHAEYLRLQAAARIDPKDGSWDQELWSVLRTHKQTVVAGAAPRALAEAALLLPSQARAQEIADRLWQAYVSLVEPSGARRDASEVAWLAGRCLDAFSTLVAREDLQATVCQRLLRVVQVDVTEDDPVLTLFPLVRKKERQAVLAAQHKVFGDALRVAVRVVRPGRAELAKDHKWPDRLPRDLPSSGEVRFRYHGKGVQLEDEEWPEFEPFPEPELDGQVRLEDGDVAYEDHLLSLRRHRLLPDDEVQALPDADACDALVLALADRDFPVSTLEWALDIVRPVMRVAPLLEPVGRDAVRGWLVRVRFAALALQTRLRSLKPSGKKKVRARHGLTGNGLSRLGELLDLSLARLPAPESVSPRSIQALVLAHIAGQLAQGSVAEPGGVRRVDQLVPLLRPMVSPWDLEAQQAKAFGDLVQAMRCTLGLLMFARGDHERAWFADLDPAWVKRVVPAALALLEDADDPLELWCRSDGDEDPPLALARLCQGNRLTELRVAVAVLRQDRRRALMLSLCRLAGLWVLAPSLSEVGRAEARALFSARNAARRPPRANWNLKQLRADQLRANRLSALLARLAFSGQPQPELMRALDDWRVRRGARPQNGYRLVELAESRTPASQTTLDAHAWENGPRLWNRCAFVHAPEDGHQATALVREHAVPDGLDFRRPGPMTPRAQAIQAAAQSAGHARVVGELRTDPNGKLAVYFGLPKLRYPGAAMRQGVHWLHPFRIASGIDRQRLAEGQTVVCSLESTRGAPGRRPRPLVSRFEPNVKVVWWIRENRVPDGLPVKDLGGVPVPQDLLEHDRWAPLVLRGTTTDQGVDVGVVLPFEGPPGREVLVRVQLTGEQPDYLISHDRPMPELAVEEVEDGGELPLVDLRGHHDAKHLLLAGLARLLVSARRVPGGALDIGLEGFRVAPEDCPRHSPGGGPLVAVISRRSHVHNFELALDDFSLQVVEVVGADVAARPVVVEATVQSEPDDIGERSWWVEHEGVRARIRRQDITSDYARLFALDKDPTGLLGTREVRIEGERAWLFRRWWTLPDLYFSGRKSLELVATGRRGVFELGLDRLVRLKEGDLVDDRGAPVRGLQSGVVVTARPAVVTQDASGQTRVGAAELLDEDRRLDFVLQLVELDEKNLRWPDCQVAGEVLVVERDRRVLLDRRRQRVHLRRFPDPVPDVGSTVLNVGDEHPVKVRPNPRWWSRRVPVDIVSEERSLSCDVEDVAQPVRLVGVQQVRGVLARGKRLRLFFPSNLSIALDRLPSAALDQTPAEIAQHMKPMLSRRGSAVEVRINEAWHEAWRGLVDIRTDRWPEVGQSGIATRVTQPRGPVEVQHIHVEDDDGSSWDVAVDASAGIHPGDRLTMLHEGLQLARLKLRGQWWVPHRKPDESALLTSRKRHKAWVLEVGDDDRDWLVELCCGHRVVLPSSSVEAKANIEPLDQVHLSVGSTYRLTLDQKSWLAVQRNRAITLLGERHKGHVTWTLKAPKAGTLLEHLTFRVNPGQLPRVVAQEMRHHGRASVQRRLQDFDVVVRPHEPIRVHLTHGEYVVEQRQQPEEVQLVDAVRDAGGSLKANGSVARMGQTWQVTVRRYKHSGAIPMPLEHQAFLPFNNYPPPQGAPWLRVLMPDPQQDTLVASFIQVPLQEMDTLDEWMANPRKGGECLVGSTYTREVFFVRRQDDMLLFEEGFGRFFIVPATRVFVHGRPWRDGGIKRGDAVGFDAVHHDDLNPDGTPAWAMRIRHVRWDVVRDLKSFRDAGGIHMATGRLRRLPDVDGKARAELDTVYGRAMSPDAVQTQGQLLVLEATHDQLDRVSSWGENATFYVRMRKSQPDEGDGTLVFDLIEVGDLKKGQILFVEAERTLYPNDPSRIRLPVRALAENLQKPQKSRRLEFFVFNSRFSVRTDRLAREGHRLNGDWLLAKVVREMEFGKTRHLRLALTDLPSRPLRHLTNRLQEGRSQVLVAHVEPDEPRIRVEVDPGIHVWLNRQDVGLDEVAEGDILEVERHPTGLRVVARVPGQREFVRRRQVVLARPWDQESVRKELSRSGNANRAQCSLSDLTQLVGVGRITTKDMRDGHLVRRTDGFDRDGFVKLIPGQGGESVSTLSLNRRGVTGHVWGEQPRDADWPWVTFRHQTHGQLCRWLEKLEVYDSATNERQPVLEGLPVVHDKGRLDLTARVKRPLPPEVLLQQFASRDDRVGVCVAKTDDEGVIVELAPGRYVRLWNGMLTDAWSAQRTPLPMQQLVPGDRLHLGRRALRREVSDHLPPLVVEGIRPSVTRHLGERVFLEATRHGPDVFLGPERMGLCEAASRRKTGNKLLDGERQELRARDPEPGDVVILKRLPGGGLALDGLRGVTWRRVDDDPLDLFQLLDHALTEPWDCMPMTVERVGEHGGRLQLTLSRRRQIQASTPDEGGVLPARVVGLYTDRSVLIDVLGCLHVLDAPDLADGLRPEDLRAVVDTLRNTFIPVQWAEGCWSAVWMAEPPAGTFEARVQEALPEGLLLRTDSGRPLWVPRRELAWAAIHPDEVDQLFKPRARVSVLRVERGYSVALTALGLVKRLRRGSSLRATVRLRREREALVEHRGVLALLRADEIPEAGTVLATFVSHRDPMARHLELGLQAAEPFVFSWPTAGQPNAPSTLLAAPFRKAALRLSRQARVDPELLMEWASETTTVAATDRNLWRLIDQLGGEVPEAEAVEEEPDNPWYQRVRNLVLRQGEAGTLLTFWHGQTCARELVDALTFQTRPSVHLAMAAFEACRREDRIDVAVPIASWVAHRVWANALSTLPVWQPEALLPGTPEAQLHDAVADGDPSALQKAVTEMRGPDQEFRRAWAMLVSGQKARLNDLERHARFELELFVTEEDDPERLRLGALLALARGAPLEALPLLADSGDTYAFWARELGLDAEAPQDAMSAWLERLREVGFQGGADDGALWQAWLNAERDVPLRWPVVQTARPATADVAVWAQGERMPLLAGSGRLLRAPRDRRGRVRRAVLQLLLELRVRLHGAERDMAIHQLREIERDIPVLWRHARRARRRLQTRGG